MRSKKIMSIIFILAGAGILAFAFILYATIKTKSTSLDNKPPFRTLIGQTVTLQRETVLYEDHIGQQTNADYPYILLDSLHPLWQYAQDCQAQPQPDLLAITKFPAGTTLHIEKAIQYTNGVSGTSNPSLFGSISSGGEIYKIGYQWGKISLEKYFDKVEKCWHFHQAPWQSQQDTAFYALPEAKVW